MIHRESITLRYKRLAHAMQAANLDVLILNPGASMYYLTGRPFHLMERPVIAIFSRGAPVYWILPELEQEKLREFPLGVKAFPFGENPATWQGVFQEAMQTLAQEINLDTASIAIEPTCMRVLELRFLETELPRKTFLSAESITAALRMIKDEEEIAAMRRAAEIAESGLLAAVQRIRLGITERELAGELTLQMLRCGADASLPFPPIVSFGENSANPHAAPGERKLRRGDLILFDWGASSQGYASDIPRIFSIGEPEEEFDRIAKIVLRANEAGRAAAAAGVPAAQVDSAARAVITESGYGQYFFHRLGHGLGLETHEHPYLHANNFQPLQAGNTFTIEPGIYLRGRGGVRIEDDCLITESACETLTSLERQLVILDL